MTESQFEEFWKYLINEAQDSDAWWLDRWLEERLEEYMNDLITPLDRKENENA